MTLAVSAQVKTGPGKSSLGTGRLAPTPVKQAPRLITPLGTLPLSQLKTGSPAPVPEISPAIQPIADAAQPPYLPASPIMAVAPLSENAESALPPAVDSQHAPIVAKAKEYIRSIMGRRAPTERESEALLEQFLESSEIDAESPTAQAVRKGVLPEAAARQNQLSARIDPRIGHWSRLLIELGRSEGLAPEHIASLAARSGQLQVLAGVRSPEVVRNLLHHLVLKDKIESTLVRYPNNEQGVFLRDVASQILTKTGKSIEEISRDGAFGYLNFSGLSVARAQSGRDPDAREPHMLFYIQYIDGKWKFSGYRQNTRPGFRGGPDGQYQKALKNWLIAGGVPESDLL